MNYWNTLVFLLGVGMFSLIWSGIGWVMESVLGLAGATFSIGLLGTSVGVLIWIMIFNYNPNRRSEE